MFQLKTSQRFIKNSDLVDSLLSKTNITRKSLILEIGTGTGIITERLVERCGNVISIEKDKKLFRAAQSQLRKFSNLTLIKGDFFKLPLPKREFICFSNIPFHRTADIVLKLLLETNKCKAAYLFMQKEAADRFMGRIHTNILSLQISPLYESEILYNCNRSDFDPKPAVDVVFIAFKKRSPPDLNSKEYEMYKRFILFIFKKGNRSVKNPLLKIMSYKKLKRLQKKLHFQMHDAPSRLSYQQLLQIFKSIE